MKINLSEIIVSEVKDVSEIDAFPKGVTFFEPYLKHDLKETLEAGGEAYLSRRLPTESSRVCSCTTATRRTERSTQSRERSLINFLD